jgi:predicted metal-dependent RNase
MKPIAGTLKKVFLVHGEPTQSETLAGLVRSQYGVEVVVPAPGDSFDLD